MLEENKDPAIMKWTAGGKAFTVDPDHAELGDVLEKYFHTVTHTTRALLHAINDILDDQIPIVKRHNCQQNS
jgi:hypothetical protein